LKTTAIPSDKPSSKLLKIRFNSFRDEKIKDKVTDDEKSTLEKAVEETLKWVESNPNAHAEEFEKKQKDLETIFNPIITKIYQAGGGEGMPGGFPGGAGGFPGGAGGFPGGSAGGSTAGPKVDEVD
jgi:L1 cell adhesion molecule like protein